AVPVKVAGTVSLVASITTVVAGAFAYRQLGYIPNRLLVLSVIMGAGSLIGVLVGTSFLPLVDKHTLKAILGGILLTATACITLPGLSPYSDAGRGSPSRPLRHHARVPRRTVTACPPRTTRGPSLRTRTTPPRFDTCAP